MDRPLDGFLHEVSRTVGVLSLSVALRGLSGSCADTGMVGG